MSYWTRVICNGCGFVLMHCTCQKSENAKPAGSVRALSMWRPWADWVMLGWKPIETRLHQRFRSLGQRPTLLAIHAASKWDNTAIPAATPWLTDDQIRLTETLIRQHPVGGHIIGTVTVMSFGELCEKDEPQALIECRSVTRYGLRLTNPTPLVPPLQTRGMQGLFTVQFPKAVACVSNPHPYNGLGARRSTIASWRSRLRHPANLASTETMRPVTSPGIDQSAESPEGPGRDGNKPLMRNRTAIDRHPR